MRINRLQVENIKRIKAAQVEFDPKQNVFQISGKNAQGKTSLMDSIWLAVGGGDAGKNVVNPIRKGETEGKVTVDLGDMIVTRIYKRAENGDIKTALQVEGKAEAGPDGKVRRVTYSSPQTLLDGLIGKLAFDPLQFAGQSEREQRKTLMALTGLQDELEAIDLKRGSIFDQRTLVNRDIKQLDGQIAGIEFVDPKTPDEETDPATVLQEMQAAQNIINRNNDDRRAAEIAGQNAMIAAQLVDRAKNEVARLEAALLQAKADVSDHIETHKAQAAIADELRGAADALVDPDMDIFNDKLADVQDTNKAVRRKQELAQLNAKRDQIHKESASLTGLIADLDKQKFEALKAAQFPIDGLGFDDTGITYNDTPWKDLCSAEQLRVSLAMAMAMNPVLKFIRISDGSLLDSDNVALIEAMAAEKGYQILMEVVDDSGTVGIYIEDGCVAGVQTC